MVQVEHLLQPMQGLERPATAFLSYAREDAEEVGSLQRLLHLRGVRAWRDVTDLTLGEYTRDQIVQAIADECDVFVLYVTPQCLKSSFIWNVEVPAALQRWERNRAFNIVPVLQGVTFTQVQRACAERGYPSLAEFNGVRLPEGEGDETKAGINQALHEIAGRILQAALKLRLRRVGAGASYEPHLCLHTFPYVPSMPSLDLDLNWIEMFVERWPSQEDWQEMLFPALRQVKDALSATAVSRSIHMTVQARLPTAFVLGFHFPSAAHLTLLLEGRHGTWSTAAAPAETPQLRQHTFEEKGDSQVAVVEVAISRHTTSAVARSLSSLGLSFGHQVQFITLGEPSDDSVKDGAQAVAMVRQISSELKRLYDRESVTHIHLFLACPAVLAVMLGHYLNALGAITLYHYMEEQGRYAPVCVLGSSPA